MAISLSITWQIVTNELKIKKINLKMATYHWSTIGISGYAWLTLYRRIHHVKFLAFHGNQLEYNGSQGANGAG